MAAVSTLATVSALLKLMFIPAYRSTDFEVHRNWLAITHSLPVNKWYVEATSEWTLDYPPLFAWFEWIMSQVAVYVDSDMVKVSNLNYASDATIIFQRVSVILTDFVFFYAIKELHELEIFESNKKSRESNSLEHFLIPILLMFNIGLFIVDHIHFQYNGVLFGIMLLSIVRILQDRTLEGAFWFSVLLNMKHIYIYIAPPYFVYLLRVYCFQRHKSLSISTLSMTNFFNLASVVLVVFALSFGPFMYYHQLGQVFSRLFPFKRGLVHAYWAPNMWALYNGLDKVLTVIGLKSGLLKDSAVPSASMTGGMVQEYSHVVLPSITPVFTMILTVCGMLPGLYILWETKTPLAFVRSIILCAFTSFLFGWHVHEKAILMIIIPLTLLVKYSKEDAKIFLILSTTGFFSLFPLLFTPFENLLKVLLWTHATIFSFLAIKNVFQDTTETSKSSSSTSHHSQSSFSGGLNMFCHPLLNLTESVYVWGLVALGFFNSGLPTWALGLNVFTQLPFLPLLLTSVYCAVGVVHCWLQFYLLFLRERRSQITEDDDVSLASEISVSSISQENKKRR